MYSARCGLAGTEDIVRQATSAVPPTASSHSEDGSPTAAGSLVSESPHLSRDVKHPSLELLARIEGHERGLAFLDAF